MSDLSQNPNWFHSDLLKTFVLNILNNSQGVKVRGINIEHEVCIEEFEISPKCKQKTSQFKDSRKFKKLVNEILNEATMQNTTQSHHESDTRLSIDFNDPNKKISNAEENH
ncbi:18867_t:CDS:2 [Gigaspora margarita]|uniref:18867_t:CDS:1 n=1 Tax=Gigaspora margarita TaxID=4874 RepID=A0ABN7UZG0_GIGMA|nr:18867_t:CDS:2 [Gigaspora margarita]